MYKEEILQIQSTLSNYIKCGMVQNNDMVVLFGAGDFSRGILNYFFSLDHFSCEYLIIDNDKYKDNSYCLGVKVKLPDDLSETEKKNGKFIICSHFWREMNDQLVALGVSPEKIIIIHLNTFEEKLFENVKAVFKGKKIYKRIRRKYKTSEILLCPYTGTGDIYLIGTFLFKFLEKERISDYVIVVVSQACKKVAELFGIDNIEVISGNIECRYLTRYYMLCPDECRLTILNDSWGNIYTNPVQCFRGLHGMDFAEMFRIFVFDLDQGVKPSHPLFPDKDDLVVELAHKYGMIKGKTVLIAPYATTLSNLPESFWTKISDELKRRGYKVFTNIGSDIEKPIPDTDGLFIPLNMVPQLVSWMGNFIGARSGLCDIISGSCAKKVILYDRNNRFFNVSAFEYFSLVKMGLSYDAVEIEYDGIDQDDLFRSVIEAF